jgi:hypothetical protein
VNIMSRYSGVDHLFSPAHNYNVTMATRATLGKSAEAFTKAAATYTNENDVDPIMKRQMETWSFEWSDNIDDTTDDDLEESWQHVYNGRLVWRSDSNPLVVMLESRCKWTDYELDWECLASARFQNHNSSDDKKQNKIYKRLVQRFENDDYINKLLKGPVVLCEASVFTKTLLEEKVFSDGDVAEGVKRAVWSSAQEPLDVFELCVQFFPLLPATRFENISSTTKLADRAQLRLLEDVMYDACETHGEEDLVDDLDIQTKKKSKTI